MTEQLPSAPPSLAKAKAQDLALLEEDARRFLTRERPGTDALQIVLRRPRDAILREYVEVTAAVERAALRAREAQQDPSLPAGLGEGGPSGYLAVANTMVAKAILGDTGAAETIMTRIEGSPGKRKGDSDEEFERRAEMMQSLEAIVREMNRRTGDEAKVIDGHANGHDEAPKANGRDKGS